ncbi:Retrovirus-related Pol polyprotein from transposon TNT 1-94 [Trichinella zimbabwensis]|uniref:Retrovirus-related Pol polyprotein from transposon TNT 1-94 n=1 Tax=Trichinella zimbabwensis TaxID=268475 RepID=A0A0V1HUU4_9BILA|nr:Retrovirus-related Pol polyprotein from transposon TNT 1-94 [Trichinella zimbabwensis]
MKLPTRQRKKWMAAAEEEMASLKIKEVSSLTPLVETPDGCNVISSKLVFKAKRHASDYDETFRPVVRHETIRTLLSIAAVKSLNVPHFDVKCAFSNAEHQEKLYMEQLPGFEDPNNNDIGMVFFGPNFHPPILLIDELLFYWIFVPLSYWIYFSNCSLIRNFHL